MKKTLYTYLLIFTAAFFAKAQQTELINNTWYLQKMIAGSNGNETLAPNNSEVSSVSATFSPTDMDTKVVIPFHASIFPGPSSALTDSTMFYDEFMFNNPTNCQIAENCTFANNYFSFFFSGFPMNYTITNEANYLKLTLTNNQGSQAIYYAQNLAVNDLDKSKNINIYPNPAKGKITINTNDKIEQVDIYSQTGQLVKTAKSKEIDISDLPKGNYIVSVRTDKDSFTQKIIKE